MKFTVTFSSANESEDLSFGLVFIPCPVWVQGEKELINLNPETPYYQAGSVRKLMERVPALTHRSSNQCTVITHQTGNGNEEDRNALIADLQSEGFSVEVIN